MNLQVFKASIVVVAQNHNPTILHPYFLHAKQIVGEDWETSEPPVCIPPLAKVVYTNGISITVKEQQLLVEYAGEDVLGGVKTAADLTGKYVSQLAHVRYTAVGINFNAFYPVEKPKDLLVGKFLTRGPWNDEDLPLSGTKIQFSYTFPDYRLNISFDVGEKNSAEQGTSEPGLIVSANYHTDCKSEESALSDALIALAANDGRYSDFLSVTKKILE